MRFNYRAKKETGEEVKGIQEAHDRFALARDLRSEGLILVSAKPAEKKTGNWRDKLRSLTAGVKLKDQIIFASNLSSMISAGLPLSRALEVIERQSSNRKFKKIISGIIDKINSGQSLSQSMGQYPDVFPSVFTSMVSAGEESGNLPEALKLVSEQLSKSYDLRRKVKGAMIYPAIVVTAIVIIAILMMIFLVPTLTETFKELEVELPLSTRIVIGISDALAQNTLLFVVGFLVLVLILGIAFRTSIGRRWWELFLLKMPMSKNLVKGYNSAVILRAISSLISSGVSMVESIKIAAKITQNSLYREVLIEAMDKVQRGVNLSSVLKDHPSLFPVLVGEMASVGEETGNLPQMLLNGAKFFEDEVDQTTKNLSTVVEPVLMLVIGAAVGFFAISMIGPMYSLTEAIN